jgi:hypothetical protein
MKYFVDQNSIVRYIWQKTDLVLFIFAGSAAEFALNKAVDWLFFTGKLPNDPLGRFFSTVGYSQKIIFQENQKALDTIDYIASIHKGIEQNRNSKIPDWAYRDVLYMLIDYTIRSYELLERKMKIEEKNEVFEVFFRMGDRMGLKDLPNSYSNWLIDREQHLKNNLTNSKYTKELFLQYKKHLGFFRYKILLLIQKEIIPNIVIQKLDVKVDYQGKLLIFGYKILRYLNLSKFLIRIIVPKKYQTEILKLEI